MKTPLLIAVTVIALIHSASVHAGSAPKSRAQVFASLPNWTGFWEQDDYQLGLSGEPTELDQGYLNSKLWFADPPYNPEWQARYDKKVKEKPAAEPICVWGFPSIMDAPYSQFELLVTPEQTLFVPIVLNATRQIFTDGRGHPSKDDLLPSIMGDSVGHWERHTLVVDTIARTAGPIGLFNDLSDKAHFIEHIHLQGPDKLVDEISIEDPVAFVRPWKVTLTYKRMKSVDRLIPLTCEENDRNPVVNGEFTIAPPRK